MKFRSLLPIVLIVLGVTLTITIGGCGGGGSSGNATTGVGKTYQVTVESIDIRYVSTGKLLSGTDALIVGQEVMLK